VLRATARVPGIAGTTTARQVVAPATTAVPLIVKLDSPHRPPQFVKGTGASSAVLEATLLDATGAVVAIATATAHVIAADATAAAA
jgi:hypothetical protein